MAKCILRPEIIAISGKVGNMLFKTMKDGTVRVYKAPSYERRKPVSEHERSVRSLFERRHKYVTELMQAGMSRSEAWKRAKEEISQ